MYVVFSFESEGTVEVVPQGWCPTESSCYWPPPKFHNQIINFITKCVAHDPKSWNLYSGKTLHKTMFYSRARELLARAELTSDLASEAETLGRGGQRRVKTTRKPDRHRSDESSEPDEELPKEEIYRDNRVPSTSANMTKKRKKMRGNFKLPTPPKCPRSNATEFSGFNCENEIDHTVGTQLEQNENNHNLFEGTCDQQNKQASHENQCPTPSRSDKELNTQTRKDDRLNVPPQNGLGTSSRNVSICQTPPRDDSGCDTPPRNINERDTPPRNLISAKPIRNVCVKSLGNEKRQTKSLLIMDNGRDVLASHENRENVTFRNENWRQMSLRNERLSPPERRNYRMEPEYFQNCFRDVNEHVSQATSFQYASNVPSTSQSNNRQAYVNEQSQIKFQKTVVMMLADLNSKVEMILRNQKEAALNSQVHVVEIEGFPTLPLQSIDDINALQNILENEDYLKQTITRFAAYGGKRLKDTCRNIMKKLFSHTLMLKFNWIGANGKLAFNNLKLKDVIIEAVKENFKSAKNYDIEVVIKNFIKYAPDREGGREKRKKPAQGDSMNHLESE